MDTNTLIALTVLIDHLQKEEDLLHETLELLQKIPKILDPGAVPADSNPPCRMAPAEPEKDIPMNRSARSSPKNAATACIPVTRGDSNLTTVSGSRACPCRSPTAPTLLPGPGYSIDYF